MSLVGAVAGRLGAARHRLRRHASRARSGRSLCCHSLSRDRAQPSCSASGGSRAVVIIEPPAFITNTITALAERPRPAHRRNVGAGAMMTGTLVALFRHALPRRGHRGFLRHSCSLVAMVDFIEMMRRTVGHEGRLGAVRRQDHALSRAVPDRARPAVRRPGRRDVLLPQSVAAARARGRPRGRRVGLAVRRARRHHRVPASASPRRRSTIRMSATLREESARLEAELFGSDARLQRRSAAASGSASAATTARRSSTPSRSSQQGVQLAGVTVFRFDDSDQFLRAHRGQERGAAHRLLAARGAPASTRRTRRRSTATIYDRQDQPDPAQVRESFATPDTVPFWQLSAYIRLAENAGLAAAGYRVQYYQLLAQPFYLAAMVLLAAAVSLRSFRFGGVQKMVLGGVAGGLPALRDVESDGRLEQGRADVAAAGSRLAAACWAG